MLTEIVRNGVLAVTEEMKIKLTRTAYNPIIYEALDFTVGLALGFVFGAVFDRHVLPQLARRLAYRWRRRGPR